MAGGTMDLAERRSKVEAARRALEGLGNALACASGDELAEITSEVDALAAAASAARLGVVVEATRRGEVTGSDVLAWVRQHAPSLRQGGAASVARIAVDVAGATGRHGTGLAPGSPLAIVAEAVVSGRLDPGTGCAVLREAARLDPLLRPDAVPTVAAALVDLAADWGPSTMRSLRPRLLAEHGHHGALDDLHDRLAAAARLSMPRIESGDLTEYQLWMTPEQAAVLEAAVGPLSAPAPNDETGEPDLRPAGRRRVEALTEVCRASSAVAADAAGDPSGSPAVLHVTVDLADLESRSGAGEVLGSVADSTLLPPETLRRLACDAALVPYVLGTAGEVLDVGHVARLFTRAQRRLLRTRDRGCTYPGCTAPADWTRAHHVRHWADGGPTDITNAALLCQRHHTLVHRRRLWATVRARPDRHGRSVEWDLSPGSYDRRRVTAPDPHPDRVASAVRARGRVCGPGERSAADRPRTADAPADGCDDVVPRPGPRPDRRLAAMLEALLGPRGPEPPDPRHDDWWNDLTEEDWTTPAA
ncbi:HNH endonuclease signature motif containing protein [Phycicoccus flavus]|uniref:DUF222 domain-containing protein n=1 Tax=Phycicoccus flavus TaxID=2502783 RepID=A0A8T6R2G9_9MICO|nr:HNH endonuclease signature motif containing protein [Phycicoccus flavus]NHA68177.1 DUF222 domain-containing protein [Phycicoccus flavus]